MKRVTLHIENPYEKREFVLEDEVTIGRTEVSQLVIADTGLSRKNTTIFRDGDVVLIVDEGSLNGTFVNGVRISGAARELRDGDKIRIGSETQIGVEIGGPSEQKEAAVARERPIEKAAAMPQTPASRPESRGDGQGRLPVVPIVAVLMIFIIIAAALIAYLFVAGSGSDSGNRSTRPTPRIMASSVIPVRVIDPLGGEDEDDLDDLIASWEVPEDEIKAENVADIKVDPADVDVADLNVTSAFLAERQRKALEPRSGETGIRPSGLDVPRELFGDGVIKQKAKLREMNSTGYQQPMDFAELAQKRMEKKLIEMPMATRSFYLDVGGSASDAPFSAFSFQSGVAEIAQGTPKYQVLAQLAANFSGQRYDLGNAGDRKQMRMRLLRMFNRSAKPILQQLADAYFQKFGRPLRVTSLTRSMDYQIMLNANNPNSFKVRGEGSLPPHTSGCAFDLARKHMTADEQNFVMQKLAEMEGSNKLDALIEYGVNACFHVFIYDDGRPPRM